MCLRSRVEDEQARAESANRRELGRIGNLVTRECEGLHKKLAFTPASVRSLWRVDQLSIMV